jgi:hypothetical protein
VIWKGETVGYIEDPRPDMWYLEGRWIVNRHPLLEDFLKAVSSLGPRQAILNGSDVWVDLMDIKSNERIKATVMCAPRETLFVRRMMTKEEKK